MNTSAFTLPNSLSAFRLMAAPVLLILAWMGQERAFIVILILAFTSDALDGLIARHLNQVSDLGSQLDSWGDLAIYITLIIAVFLLWSELLLEHAVFAMPVIIGVLAVPLVNLLKFRSLSSYHTWLTKVGAVSMFIGGFILLAGGPAWPFRLACVLCTLAAAEQILISLYLTRKRSNVKSFWHVLRDGH